jgi:transposase
MGSAAYGAGLARHFARAAVTVIEVDRPNRQKRRRHGKSDQLDAIEAARAALSGRCQVHAKSGDSFAEAIRALLIAKRSARSTRIRTIVQLRHLVFTVPDELRAKLGGLTPIQLGNEAAKLRPRAGRDVVVQGIQDRGSDPALAGSRRSMPSSTRSTFNSSRSSKQRRRSRAQLLG